MNMRFDPMGRTSNPKIPDATSILDYVAQFLAMEFVLSNTREASAA